MSTLKLVREGSTKTSWGRVTCLFYLVKVSIKQTSCAWLVTSKSKTRIFHKFHTNKKLLRCQRRMRTIWDCSWVEVINKITDNRRKAKITGSMSNNITSNTITLARSSIHSRITAGNSDSRAKARSSSQIIKSTKSKMKSRRATAGRESRPTKVMPDRKMIYPTTTI